MTSRWAAGLSALLAALLMSGCGESGTTGSASGSGTPSGGAGSIQITYRPETHVMSRDEGKAMILGVSTNTAAFFLDPSNPKTQALKVGDSWLVKDMFARKIIGLETQPTGEVLALTEPADLTDLASTAHLNVAQPVRFGNAQGAQLLDVFGDLIAPPAHAQSAGGQMLHALGGALIEGWKVTTNPSFEGGKLKIKMELTREEGGFKGVINVDGYLDGFDFDGRIDIEQSKYERISQGLKKLNGQLDVTYSVGSDAGPGARTGDFRIKLPASVQIPLSSMLEGLPLYLEISSALILKPALSGGSQFSTGTFRVTYNGSQNFSLQSGTIQSDGSVKGDIQFTKGQNVSALAPMGMVVALAAPRIELSLGFDKMFEGDELKKAADIVDKAASALAKAILTPEQYSAWEASPLSAIKLGDAVEASVKSDAAAWFQIVTTSGTTSTGMSVIVPCTRTELSIAARVGASAEAFGQSLGETEKDIFRSENVHIDPPGTKLCELGDPK